MDAGNNTSSGAAHTVAAASNAVGTAVAGVSSSPSRTFNYSAMSSARHEDIDKSPHSQDSTSSSTAATTTTSSSSSSSAPVYSDDRLLYADRAALPSSIGLLPRQGSGSSTKTCEVDLGEEERDSYSPLSSSHSSNSPSDAPVVVTAAAAVIAGICNGSSNSGALQPPPPSQLLVDNKIYDGCSLQPLKNMTGTSALTATPSKEEKQRQNEEIVIMETSSISSETGSWESVFPHATPLQPVASGSGNGPRGLPLETLDLRNCCAELIHEHDTSRKRPEKSKQKEKDKEAAFREEHHRREQLLADVEPLRSRTYSTGATADTSSLFNGVGVSGGVGGGSSSSLSVLRDFEKHENALTASGTSACFIDASSLRDEDEVLSFPSLDGLHSNDALDGFAGGRESAKRELAEENDDDATTKKLESFHKSFAKCKAKTKDVSRPGDGDRGVVSESMSRSGSASSCSDRSPQKEATCSPTNNLSDEEKLWKREISSTHPLQQAKSEGGGGQYDNRDLSQETNQQLFSTAHEDATEASTSLAADLDSSDSSDIVKLRREQQEQRQSSSSAFQKDFQPYPSALGQPGAAHKLPFQCVAPNATLHSDLSYTTDYSSSSPAPSLVWSEHEHRPSAAVRHQPLHHPHLQHFDDYDAHLHRSCPLMPDTPHNSIAHIVDHNSSNTSSIHRDYTLSSSFSQQRDSGAYCSDATDSPVPMPRTPKRTKCDEANPIVSGGASIKDFSVKPCESPTVRRRTETCPIVSGGFRSLDFESTRPRASADDEDDYDAETEGVELRPKPTTRKPISALTSSWIVDMSDCRPERRKSTSSTSSVENAQVAKFRERTDSSSSHKSGCGFYVSLQNMDEQKAAAAPSSDNGGGGGVDRPKPSQMSKSYTGPRSTGFFVNLDDNEVATAAPATVESSEPKKDASSAADKKNIFSMFIDFGEKKPSTTANGKREPFNLGARLSSSFTSTSMSASSHQRRSLEDPMRSSASSTETLMSKSNTFKPNQLSSDNDSGLESRSLDYKCNLEKPITVADLKRISQQHRAQSEASKRHSWGTSSNSQAQGEAGAIPEYKRSTSLTTTGNGTSDGKSFGNSGGGLMSIIDKLPLISKTSSLSIDSSLSPLEDVSGSKSELSSCSNISARNSVSGGEDNGGNPLTAAARMKKRRRDVQINETFDKSSIASLTDGVLSKDLSPASTTDTDDLTFQQDEELASREAALHQMAPTAMQVPSARSSAIIMETILEAKETSSPKKTAGVGHTMESLHATIEKQKQLLETVTEHGGDHQDKSKASAAPASSFVKLSDMDKPVVHSPETMMSKSAGGTHRPMNRLYRDDALKASARPHSWTMTRSTGNSNSGILNITTSVDNLRSLSRIFPNFSKEFSNSLPNDMILDQQMDDYIQTDISADSSLASSFSRSGMDESSISCRQPRRLGEDLLKMFLQEIATDMIVEVSGRRIRAHKCILRSRCQYFAAMLAGNGGGGQSVVTLPGYSYSAVHFALCHIYSGASHPPDGISLMELAALADLLGLEGLKEVTTHALKTNYCHNFHKPCSGCIDGILQVLPVALNHALDDLYRKCLRWTCRHYLKVWPTRQFAQLPSDILGRCRQQIVAYLTSETVLDTVLDCDSLIAQLAPYRWGRVCENLVRDILDSAYNYIGDHFASLIASDAFLSLGHDKSCHIPRLQDVLLRTASSLTPDQACRSYQRVTRLNTLLQEMLMRTAATLTPPDQTCRSYQEVTRLNAALQSKAMKVPTNLGDIAKELQGLQEEDLEWDPEYVRLVSAILSSVEQCLTRQCSRAMRVTAWQRMDLDLRKKIQTLARLTEPMDMKRSKPVAKAFSFGGSTRNQDLYQVKLAIQAHSKRALAQDTQLYKATQTQDGVCNVQTIERGVQANHDLREGTSKVLKSNSRAHVPQAYKGSQSTTGSERNSINTHRRTQSEAPITRTAKVTASQSLSQQHQQQQEIKPAPKPRLNEVRPRYLEPRKPRGFATNGPVRSATSSSIAASKTKGHHISSSDSSRNSSPAARKNLANAAANKSNSKSINMSMDNLSSPSRRQKNSKTSDNERSSDVCVDSMAESMKSSMVSNTNKTISQESLSSAAKLSRSNPVIINHTAPNNNNNKMFRTTQQSASNKLNGNFMKPQMKGSSTAVKAQLKLQPLQQTNMTSTGSSPTSVVTTKSTSRLSSISSTNSPRDLYKHRSISVPAQDNSSNSSTTGHGGRRSFLSAKSREILARRAEKNKQQRLQSASSGDEKTHSKTVSGIPPMRSSSHSAVPLAINRNSSLTSNIPTRRPNTLHLKKTHQVNSSSNTNSNNNNKTTATNIKNKVASSHGYKSTVGHAVQQKIELLIDSSVLKPSMKEDLPPAATRIETKLERSSTFCKESSDLDLNELQIIE